MTFLHKTINAGPNDQVVVDLDSQANVLLMDDYNFNCYRRGQRHQYYGGWATRSPARLRPPSTKRWNVVIDLGGKSGNIRAGIRVIPC